ncbi:MAG TPA: peptide-methionine (S)-S-oxide reductase MsrA [Gallionellaceae bacterium]|nr:peptide-methionine (S)-S-oxide reductase MsrA [Gallionellaceae bacterium]
MKNDGRQVATFAGGCFWCLEAVFEQVCGVGGVVSGYTGGELPNPGYEAVCSGKTGHAEAVQITYDAEQITYEELLGIFFSIHDPTTPNRQGNDAGTQYRSAIFYHGDGQRKEAEAMIAELNKKRIWQAPIVTEVAAAQVFYPAEENHQHYFARHPEQGYCQFTITPKLAKFREYFGRLVKVL